MTCGYGKQTYLATAYSNIGPIEASFLPIQIAVKIAKTSLMIVVCYLFNEATKKIKLQQEPK